MVKAKKIWGQHFLKDIEIAQRVISSLSLSNPFDSILEIGPGKGVLTGTLLKQFEDNFFAVEIDPEMNEYLLGKFPGLKGRLLHENFLKLDIPKYFEKSLAIIGNFPYNISSQIVFKALENRDQVAQVVGMFQKEMAKRIVAEPGKKDYGIISVFTRCYYESEFLFEVEESSFAPPPKVKSAVIRLIRNSTKQLDCDEILFKKVVKASFNKRRKKMRNSLKELIEDKKLLQHNIFDNRPEQMALEDFKMITQMITS